MLDSTIKPTLPLDDHSKELTKLKQLVNSEIDFYWKNNEPKFADGVFLVGGSFGYLNGWSFLPDLDCALHELAHCIEIPKERGGFYPRLHPTHYLYTKRQGYINLLDGSKLYIDDYETKIHLR